MVFDDLFTHSIHTVFVTDAFVCTVYPMLNGDLLKVDVLV